MPTFPYTPSYVHGEAITYAIQVHRFQDWSEQRYRLSRQSGLRLSYEFPRPSSATVAGVASFFLAMGGPATTFVAVDHRDVSTHTVRFAAPTLDHLMGPIHTRRALRVEFVRDLGGTTPITTAYVPPVIPDFCDAVMPTSGVVSPTGGEPAADTASGFVFAPPGGHPAYWQRGRWRVAGMPKGSLLLDKVGGESPFLWAIPFYVADSTTILDTLRVTVVDPPVTGQVRLGIYVAIGSHDLYPGSQVLAHSATLALTALGNVTAAMSATLLRPNLLYFAVMAVTSFTSLTKGVRAVADDNSPLVLGIGSGSNVPGMAWAGSHGFTLPSPFPQGIPLYTEARMPAISWGVASGTVVV